MSDFNPLDRAKIPTHRSSFDLSSKKLFTAKVGEILPCYWQIAIPGTKYRISSDWFTRTVPVNTAAYTRIKEYYDFYAVPLRLISRALPQAFTQMTDYMTSAASNASNTEQLTSVPYAPLGNISGEIRSRVAAGAVDDAGFGFGYGSCKLLDMLCYGSFIGSSNDKKAEITKQYLGLDTTSLADSQNPLIYGTSVNLNLLPALAYQKIYFDFFSNSQWEKHLAYAYNVDYWDGKSSVEISSDMIRLRYADYPKDYFLGVLPASQYGSVAVLPALFLRIHGITSLRTEHRGRIGRWRSSYTGCKAGKCRSEAAQKAQGQDCAAKTRDAGKASESMGRSQECRVQEASSLLQNSILRWNTKTRGSRHRTSAQDRKSPRKNQERRTAPSRR